MDLEELRAVQADERSTDSLQALPETFYRDVAEYIEGLREERERAADRADDPFSSEDVRRLTDEIETAEEVVEAVYDRRIGKVVKRASLAAAGMAADDQGMTREEADLFGALVDRIQSNRAHVLDAVAGEADLGGAETEEAVESPRADPAPPGDGTASTDAPTLDIADAMGGTENPPPEDEAEPPSDADGGPTAPGARPAGESSGEQASPASATEDPETGAETGADGDDRTTVRITREVGEIFGVDERTYTLGEEDVVTLPTANAKPLLDRDAAQRLD